MGMAWKGGWNENETGRALSLWLTGGTDKTQFVRSVMSGGHAGHRAQAHYQVGDLAPNGPAAEEFRRRFAVECKSYNGDPEWWHAFSSSNWVVAQWWKKIVEECAPHKLEPLLIMKRNRCPVVIMMREPVCRIIHLPTLVLPQMGAAVIGFKEFLKVPPQNVFHGCDVLRTHEELP